MKVVWTDPAIAQLQGIYAFIALTSEAIAQRRASEIVARADALGDFPLMGRVVPERNNPALRELIVRPYRVIYLVGADRVDIIAVIHGARGVLEDLL